MEFLTGHIGGKWLFWGRPDSEGDEGVVDDVAEVELHERDESPVFREMPYYSDSIHRVSVDDLESLVLGDDSVELQLLLHPVNWIAGGSSGFEILIRGWTRVLRDHERTLLENGAYVGRLPTGTLPQLVENFEREILAAAAAA